MHKKITLKAFLKKVCEEDNFELLKDYEKYVKKINDYNEIDKIKDVWLKDQVKYYKQIVSYGLFKKEYWIFPIIESLCSEDNTKEIIGIVEDLITNGCLMLMGISSDVRVKKGSSIYSSTNQNRLEEMLSDNMCFQISSSIMKTINIVKVKEDINKEQKIFNDSIAGLVVNYNDILIKQNEIKDCFFEKLDNLKRLIDFEQNMNKINISIKKVKNKL